MVTSMSMVGQLAELTRLIQTLSPYPIPLKATLLVAALDGMDIVPENMPWLRGEKVTVKVHV